ncbi:MAG: phosphoribosyltransferase family protein [Anaeromicrobium sp.]|jgi:predicted phosphoribosyltransferase|uniref:phosphoribosyltransferase n=1 Tax=Anaeromicrobium sp. TaxID=1929132 RepID=UPI0025DA5D94|nr:phosphoribosyltransferase family protein [Anaeromicrobium sp.]MCT4594397.1 phosphoribosyltransferase family protein [Anaeromicrobium sp.]
MFKDRFEASKRLSKLLSKYKGEDVIALPIPRGGLPVAYDSIIDNNFHWDLIIPRKIRSPMNKEIALGAVAPDGTYFVNENYVYDSHISEEYIQREVEVQIKEIHSRTKKFKGNANFPKVKDKIAILIDDGIATGFTTLAAIESLKKQGAKKIVIATPIAPENTVHYLSTLVDEVISIVTPINFVAVGFYYDDFSQIEDTQVSSLIEKLSLYNKNH